MLTSPTPTLPSPLTPTKTLPLPITQATDATYAERLQELLAWRQQGLTVSDLVE